MTLDEAKTALAQRYIDARLSPTPVIGVHTGTYEGRSVLRVFVNMKTPAYVPEECRPGAGFEGFEVVGYVGLAHFISTSGPPA